MKNEKIKVAVIMGSKSDMDTVQETVSVLDAFKISYELRVLSAHRTPKDVIKYVEKLSKRGVRIIIAAAGMSAALAGTIAAHTVLPVIGIPIDTKALKGMDSLLSTVQMPRGVPVACMAIGKSGAYNGALFACQILALSDRKLEKKLLSYKEDMADEIRKIKL